MINLKDVLATRKNYYPAAAKRLPELPNPDVILKKEGKRIEAYEDLLTDSHVWSVTQSRKAGVLSLEWEINLGGNETAEVVFIKKIFENLNMERIIEEMLDAPLFGYSVLEIYWRVIDGKIVPVDIVGKPKEWFFFDDKNICRFRQYGVEKGIGLPPRKVFVVQHKPTYNNPYGSALLSKCYWPVFYKKEEVKFWAIFSEKFGMPWINLQMDDDATEDDIDDAIAVTQDSVQDAIIVTKGNNKANVLDINRAASTAIYKDFIAFLNAEMSKAILSQTLTTEQSDTGSYSMSQTHMEVRADVVDSDKKLVEHWFNKLIEWTVEMNFGKLEEMPKFIMFQEEDVDLTLADRDSKLAGTGQVKFTKKYLKKAYGFEDDDIEIVDAPVTAPAFAEATDTEVVEDKKGIVRVQDLALDDFAKASAKILEPVLKLIDEGVSYDMLQDKIQKIFPTLNTAEIEELIAKGILVANAGGQLSVKS